MRRVFYCHFPGKPWPLGNDGTWDVRFAHSYDGADFSYVAGDRRPFVARGVDGPTGPSRSETAVAEGAAWDAGVVAVAKGLVLRDRTVRLFKVGNSLRHGQDHVVDPATGKPQPTGAVVAYDLRMDGFASAGPAESDFASTAELVTAPVIFSVGAPELHANYAASGGGSLTIGLRFADNGTAVPGFEESHALSDNQVEAIVTWPHKGAPSDAVLRQYAGTPINVVVAFRGACQLFSLKFCAEGATHGCITAAALKADDDEFAPACPAGYKTPPGGNGYWKNGYPDWQTQGVDHENATVQLCAKKCSSMHECAAFEVYAGPTDGCGKPISCGSKPCAPCLPLGPPCCLPVPSKGLEPGNACYVFLKRLAPPFTPNQYATACQKLGYKPPPLPPPVPRKTTGHSFPRLGSCWGSDVFITDKMLNYTGFPHITNSTWARYDTLCKRKDITESRF